MFKEENGRVYLDISLNDWEHLIFSLGLLAGYEKDIIETRKILDLVNRLNEGNPDFAPYRIKGK